MKSFEDAKAACAKAQDPFYLDAFMIEAWLGDVVLEAATEYAEKKNAKNRAMQCGQGWRGFLKVFGHAQDEDCLLYTSPSPRDRQKSRMPSSA